MTKPFHNTTEDDRNEQGAACCKHGDPSKANATFHGGDDMPFEHEYGDSAPKDKIEQNETWQSIGDAAARLVAKAEFLPIGESLIDYDDEVAE